MPVCIACRHDFNGSRSDALCPDCMKDRMGSQPMNAPDPAAWAAASAAAGATPVEFVYKPPATIDYHLTPQYFTLFIPVEALENLNPDAHTRMLALLNDWISRHKPTTVLLPPRGNIPSGA